LAKLTYLFLALPIATLGVATAQAKPACPITQAVYSQPGDNGVKAGFVLQGIKTAYASDLVFWVKAGSDTYWFGFQSPNGYGGTYVYQRLAPSAIKPAADGETPSDQAAEAETDEPQQMMFDAFDIKLKAYSGPPQASDAAPAYLFARELGPLFHYAHNGNAYIAKGNAPVKIDIAMWQQTGCSTKPHK
jgi:hypothetical protein